MARALPPLRLPAGSARVSGARPADLRGLLRNQELVHIACPSDCSWLASARDHPAAVVIRQQQRDVGLLVQFMSEFNERQSQLFILISTFLVRYQPPELQAPIDEDVAEAATALGRTLETAASGVIYDHRPASLPAERLVAALRPVLAEAGRGAAGTAFERDAAVVLRRLADAVAETRATGSAESACLSRFPRSGHRGAGGQGPGRAERSALDSPVAGRL